MYRSRSGLAMMLLAPLILSGAIGAAFGSGNNFSLSPVKTVVVDQDSGGAAGGAGAGSAAPVTAGAAITAALTSPELADLLTVSQAATPEAARSAVDSGQAEVAVIIPPGLTQSLSAAATSPRQVEIYKDPTLMIGPAIVTSVVQDVSQSLNGARAAASATAQLAASQGVTDRAALAALAAKAAQAYGSQARSSNKIAVESRSPVTPGGSASDAAEHGRPGAHRDDAVLHALRRRHPGA